MIKFLYGEEIHAHVWKEKADDILKAAGKYGFGNFKRQAEAWHVKNEKLTVDNAVDCLLQADGNDLPLLKKASIEFIVANAIGIVASESYSCLDEAPPLRRGVMLAMAEHINQLSESKKTK